LIRWKRLQCGRCEEIAGDQIIDNREQRRRTAIGALDGKAANEAEVKFWAEEHERYRGDF
jgi:hypothetical protein